MTLMKVELNRISDNMKEAIGVINKQIEKLLRRRKALENALAAYDLLDEVLGDVEVPGEDPEQEALPFEPEANGDKTGKQYRTLKAAVRAAMIELAGKVVGVDQVVEVAQRMRQNGVALKQSVMAQLSLDYNKKILHRIGKNRYVLPKVSVPQVKRSLKQIKGEV